MSEWWDGQKEIILLDANILACKERMDLLQQLAESGAYVDFTQGLDARFMTEEVAKMLKKIKVKMYHFAFDFMKNERRILQGLEIFKRVANPSDRKCAVYVLTNYNTSIAEDLYRVEKITQVGFMPDIRIYRKESLPRPHILRDLQRWCNNRFIFRSEPSFMCYKPRDDKTIKEIYFERKMV